MAEAKKQESKAIVKEENKAVEKQEDIESIVKKAVVEGIKESKKEVSMSDMIEAEININLKKDGKYPIGMVFESDSERRININVEMPDGVCHNHHVDIFPIITDTFLVDLKKYEMPKRAFSQFYAIPAKRVISCNAEKIYLIY